MQNKVKDTQRVFRKIVDSLSRPGKTIALESTFSYQTQLVDEMMDVLMTLLDGEVSFHLIGEDAKTVEEIEIRTLSKQVAISKADYIVFPAKEDQGKLIEALRQAKKGTLVDPNRSATFLIETMSLKIGDELAFSGPGIEASQQVFISEKPSWLAERNDAVSEYPLGVDCFVIDELGNCIGIPRTTVIEEVY